MKKPHSLWLVTSIPFSVQPPRDWARGLLKIPFFSLVFLLPSRAEMVEGGKVRWEPVWGGRWEIPGIFLPLCLGVELKGRDAELH